MQYNRNAPNPSHHINKQTFISRKKHPHIFYPAISCKKRTARLHGGDTKGRSNKAGPQQRGRVGYNMRRGCTVQLPGKGVNRSAGESGEASLQTTMQHPPSPARHGNYPTTHRQAATRGAEPSRGPRRRTEGGEGKNGARGRMQTPAGGLGAALPLQPGPRMADKRAIATKVPN